MNLRQDQDLLLFHTHCFCCLDTIKTRRAKHYFQQKLKTEQETGPTE